jgi:hypothetical protein
LVSDPATITIELPRELVPLIVGAIRHLHRPLSVSVGGAGGLLRTHFGHQSKDNHSQGLWNWEIEAETRDDRQLHVRLSASLGTDRLWAAADDGSTHRLIAEFTVDSPTRLAIGAPSGETNVELPLDRTARPSSIRMSKLKNAAVGFQLQLAPSSAGKWTNIVSEAGTLSLEKFHRANLTTMGLTWSTHWQRPRLTIKGMDMDDVAELVRDNLRARLVLEGKVGHANYFVREVSDLPPGVNRYVKHADLDFSLGEAGLSLDYRIVVNDAEGHRPPYRDGIFEDQLILPWELLLLRFPQIGVLRSVVLERLTAGDKEPSVDSPLDRATQAIKHLLKH